MTTHPARAHRASRGLVRAPSNELGPLHPPSLAASAESAPPSFVFTFSHDDRPTTLSLALLTRLLPPVVPAAPALPCPPFRKCNRQVICIAVARPSAHGVMGKGRTTSAICQAGQLNTRKHGLPLLDVPSWPSGRPRRKRPLSRNLLAVGMRTTRPALVK